MPVERVKMDRAYRIALALAVVVLLVSILLATGTAFARYRFRQTSELLFAPKTSEEVYLWGGVVEEDGFLPLPGEFTTDENGQNLTFLIANGTDEENFAQETKRVQIRMACTLGLGAAKNLTASLTAGEEIYSAVARKIDENSPMHKTFGEGWVYVFVDAEGEELQWALEGGRLSVARMKLTVQASGGAAASMLQLLVTAEE